MIGGGYATGRELAEFFVPGGPWGGLLAMVLAMVLFSLVCVVTFLFARATAASTTAPSSGTCSGRSGSLFEAAYVFFIILILAVFGAAAGAIGEAMFGWPPIAGALCLIAGIVAVHDLRQPVGRVAVQVRLVLPLRRLRALRGPSRSAASATASPAACRALSRREAGRSAGVTYASYNVVGAVVILPVLRHLTSSRDAVIAGLLAGPLAMIPAVLFFLCMIAWYPADRRRSAAVGLHAAPAGPPAAARRFPADDLHGPAAERRQRRACDQRAHRGPPGRAPPARFLATGPPRRHRTPAVRRDLRRRAVRPRGPDRQGLSPARLMFLVIYVLP